MRDTVIDILAVLMVLAIIAMPVIIWMKADMAIEVIKDKKIILHIDNFNLQYDVIARKGSTINLPGEGENE